MQRVHTMISLGDREIGTLLDQPESGMGFQSVELGLKGVGAKRGVALNAELVLLEEDLAKGRGVLLLEKAITQALGASQEVEWIRVLKPGRGVSKGVSDVFVADAGEGSPGPAADAPCGTTLKAEVFKRFSAYKNDRRIRDDRSLRPGSYATTERDAKNVATGAEAVERYALPDPTPAVYVFTVEPDEGTPVRRGTVQPAHGHDGGGAEVLFDKGTQARSVSGPAKIPDR